jgi:hypothetical protein
MYRTIWFHPRVPAKKKRIPRKNGRLVFQNGRLVFCGKPITLMKCDGIMWNLTNLMEEFMALWLRKVLRKKPQDMTQAKWYLNVRKVGKCGTSANRQRNRGAFA